MIVIQDTDTQMEPQLAATIGFFDGVHEGHRFLIEELKRVSHQRALPTAVITFSHHPRAVLRSDYQPQLLNSHPEKLKALATTGIDYCIVLDFTPELSLLTAQQFIREILAEKLHVRTLLIGYDHRFGHNRAEGFSDYVRYGQQIGMEVVQATAYSEGKATVSSSEIRRLLAEGNVRQAAHLLTYPYTLQGHIVEGHQVGRQLGFPTANIAVDDPNKLIPAAGVYAVQAEVAGGTYGGMLCIGNRPTLQNGTNISLEVNLFEFAGDIYHQSIQVSFLDYIRKNIRFESLEALREQLNKDKSTIIHSGVCTTKQSIY